MENSFKKYNHRNCASIINVNTNDKHRSNIICSEDGLISITKSFYTDQCDLIRLSNKINACHYANGNMYLGNELNQLIIFDLDKKIILKTINGFKRPLHFIATCLDLLGCCCLCNEIYFIDLNDFSIRNFNTYQNSVYFISFEPKKDYFITADQDTINIWNFKNSILLKNMKNQISSRLDNKKIENIIWHKNGYVFAISKENSIEFFERQSWQLKFRIKTWVFFNFISFSPKGQHILAACDSIISIYNLSTLRLELELKSKDFMINSILWYENRILFTHRIIGSFTMIRLDLFKSLPHDLKDQLSDKEISLLALE